jgi:hypothetical protein
VLVSVEDTGLGIPEDKLQAVFEAFEQVRWRWGRGGDGGACCCRMNEGLPSPETVESMQQVGRC